MIGAVRRSIYRNQYAEKNSFHAKTGPVSRFHLCVYEAKRPPPGRGGHAEIFQSHSTISAPNGYRARKTRARLQRKRARQNHKSLNLRSNYTEA